MMVDATLNHWQLDKRVPVALMLAVFIQSLTAVWWAANVTARIEFIERRSAIAEESVSKLATTDLRILELLASYRTGQEDIRRSLDKLDTAVNTRKAL